MAYFECHKQKQKVLVVCHFQQTYAHQLHFQNTFLHQSQKLKVLRCFCHLKHQHQSPFFCKNFGRNFPKTANRNCHHIFLHWFLQQNYFFRFSLLQVLLKFAQWFFCIHLGRQVQALFCSHQKDCAHFASFFALCKVFL